MFILTNSWVWFYAIFANHMFLSMNYWISISALNHMFLAMKCWVWIYRCFTNHMFLVMIRWTWFVLHRCCESHVFNSALLEIDLQTIAPNHMFLPMNCWISFSTQECYGACLCATHDSYFSHLSPLIAACSFFVTRVKPVIWRAVMNTIQLNYR